MSNQGWFPELIEELESGQFWLKWLELGKEDEDEVNRAETSENKDRTLHRHNATGFSLREERTQYEAGYDGPQGGREPVYDMYPDPYLQSSIQQPEEVTKVYEAKPEKGLHEKLDAAKVFDQPEKHDPTLGLDTVWHELRFAFRSGEFTPQKLADIADIYGVPVNAEWSFYVDDWAAQIVSVDWQENY